MMEYNNNFRGTASTTLFCERHYFILLPFVLKLVLTVNIGKIGRFLEREGIV